MGQSRGFRAWCDQVPSSAGIDRIADGAFLRLFVPCPRDVPNVVERESCNPSRVPPCDAASQRAPFARASSLARCRWPNGTRCDRIGAWWCTPEHAASPAASRCACLYLCGALCFGPGGGRRAKLLAHMGAHACAEGGGDSAGAGNALQNAIHQKESSSSSSSMVNGQSRAGLLILPCRGCLWLQASEAAAEEQPEEPEEPSSMLRGAKRSDSSQGRPRLRAAHPCPLLQRL